MIEDEKPLFDRNHNLPAGMLALEDAIEELNQLLTERLQAGDKTYLQRRDEFIRAAQAAVVRDRETAGAAADIIKLANKVRQAIEAQRLDRSNPYRAVAEALAAHVDRFWEPARDALQKLDATVDAWADAEDARIKQQEAEQEAEMARLRAMAAPVSSEPSVEQDPGGYIQAGNRHGVSPDARRSPVRGDYGGRVARVQETIYEIEDVRAIPTDILLSPGVQQAILAAVKKVAPVLGVPAGIRARKAHSNRIG